MKSAVSIAGSVFKSFSQSPQAENQSVFLFLAGFYGLVTIYIRSQSLGRSVFNFLFAFCLTKGVDT